MKDVVYMVSQVEIFQLQLPLKGTIDGGFGSQPW